MSNKWPQSVVAVLVGTSLTAIGHATVLHVPGDYAGIQIAIDACNNGDVILVSPGEYSENINFKGKAITLSSTNPADFNVVSRTIIRASGQGSVVTFAHGETSNSVLMGFTISGGYGTTNSMLGTNYYWGAGVYCYGSSPTILGNIISGNSGPQGGGDIYGYGGGIGCIQSDATILRNLIAANGGYGGGGITTESGKARIADNVICSNSAVLAGGVLLVGGAQFLNNTVVGNSAQFAGNVYAYSYANGQCLLADNIICNATTGGGIYVESQSAINQTTFNDVWNNTGGDYYAGTNRTGLNGNISQDPQFVDAGNNDYHLRDVSPCINAGDPQFQPPAGESDFYGSARVYAGRVDIGASEYFDNFRPVANAGPDQLIAITALPALIALDGSSSSDPNGAVLSYHWSQVSGPAGSFFNSDVAKPTFSASALGTYRFQLVVNNASYNSFAAMVQVTLKNDPPVAAAGADQIYSDLQPIPAITLDGSRSFDPQNAVLSYHWTQLSGWQVQLSDPNAVKPSFMHPWPGTYLFQLVVNNGVQDSKPAVVAIYIGPDRAPVADPGSSRYVSTDSIMLDGTRSYEPTGVGTLAYQWRQVSGPAVTITGADTAVPLVSGFKPTNTLQQCVFELVVSDGYMSSQPSNVIVTIVPDFGANALMLVNPPFDPTKPTIVAFNGGNCRSGSGMTFGDVWEQLANWLTVDSYRPPYKEYGDMVLVFLSSVAPDYRQPIQTIGWSTGNLPAMEIGWYLNTIYKDARYAINRVTLLDAVCQNPITRIRQFNATPVAREQCWVDNYISNDSRYSPAGVVPGTLNVVCRPPRDHSYPVVRYASSSWEYSNGGLTAFGYLSVIGDGKNYQLNTSSNMYYFDINSNEDVVFYNQSLYPGKILSPVQLTGPADGATLGAQGAVLGCQPVENAVGYQLLLGSTADRVMDYTILSDTTNPPQQTLSTLPQNNTWWTVRAYDQYGSTIYADPRLIRLPANTPPVADAGPDQILYAGLDGTATVTLDGSKSADPDGDALSYTWAWAVGANAYLTNGVSPMVELPIGGYTIQLMVNDGHVNSQPAQVKITVVAPLECKVTIAPSTINLRGKGPRILAAIRFPGGVTAAEVSSDQPLLLYPGGLQATRQWAVGGRGEGAILFGFFVGDDLSGVLPDGSAELTVAGRLSTGRMFYGSDTVRIIGQGKGK